MIHLLKLTFSCLKDLSISLKINVIVFFIYFHDKNVDKNYVMQQVQESGMNFSKLNLAF